MNIKKEIYEELDSIHFDNYDLSDIGNAIGIIVGKNLNENKLGWEIESFIAGFTHGLSLADGSHDNKNGVNINFKIIKKDE